MIINLDGSISAQLHQVDRFGALNSHWVAQNKKLGWPYNKGGRKQTAGVKEVGSKAEEKPQSVYTNSDVNGRIFLRPSDFKPLDSPQATVLYADAEGSAKFLLKEAQTPRSIPDENIDHAVEEARCKRYDLKYSGRKERRKVYYGSNIAGK